MGEHHSVDTSTGDWTVWLTLLRRGATRRCANCGAGHLYRGWFRMVDRCPGCGIRFERERGFFTGAYLMNFAATVVVLFIGTMGYVVLKAIDHDASPRGVLIALLIVAVLMPPLFYPFSRTLWSAIDIGMTPLTGEELAEAVEALAAGDVGRVDADDPSKRLRRRSRTDG